MSEEILEFSAEDLGRLAWHLARLQGVLDWLERYAVTPDEAARIRAAVIVGYNDEGQ